ncbi:MAG: CoA pyrophosphatase [Gammaproteobacteria bacterium]|nr:CoA pyrophosphatase [Gammaproteobacteria bacterium]
MSDLLPLQCDDRLRALIEARLARFPRLLPGAAGRAAAVAVAITDEGHGADLSGMPRHPEWQADAALLLTRRSARLRNHAGQWAFPGGRIDPGESPEETALREMREEIGLALPDSAVIGRLDDFVTRSGYVMTPVVVWAGARPALVLNEDEVASVHRIPVRELLRGDAPLLDPGPEPDRPVLRMPVGDDWIAAPTAAILYQFREVCVLDQETRVAHYDQPAFAWR